MEDNFILHSPYTQESLFWVKESHQKKKAAQLWKFSIRGLTSLSKHMGDGKVKLGRGPYAISTAILSMYVILLFLHVVFHVVLQISVE